MKRDHRQGVVSLLICSALAGFAAIPADQVELFQNTGFEEELKEWRALDMSKTCQFEIDKKVKQAGKASLRIERGDGERPDFLKQFVDLPADTGELTFSVMTRIEKEGGARVTLLFSDGAETTLSQPEVGVLQRTRKKWKELSGSFKVPEGARRVGVNFWFSEPGVVWLDEVSLQWDGPSQGKTSKQADSLTLDNGDFSKGLQGWDPIDLGQSTVKGSHDRRIGAGSLRLEREGQRLFPLGGYETRVPRNKREKRVKLSFCVRADPTARACLSLQALGEGGALLATERTLIVPRGKQLSPGQLTMDVPDGTVSLALVASLGGTGKVWFDDFKLGGK